jgi:hypothetical protein
MCSVSAVSQYYLQPGWPGQLNPPLGQWPQTFQQVVQADPEMKEMLRKAIQLLDKIDKKLGDADCKDEQKAEFYRALDLPPP